MKIKKLYSFTNKRQIWRLLPAGENIIIEERDPEKKEAFFNCIEMETGKVIFKNLQLEEKFWIGIEKISCGIILFHKYEKPDLPRHKGILAFNIETKNVLWENPDLNYLFVYDQKVYCYRDKFEGRLFFTLDIKTGSLLDELGSDVNGLNKLREKLINEDEYSDYSFPEIFFNKKNSDVVNRVIQNLEEEYVITGPIEIIEKDSLIFISYFEVFKDGLLKNFFNVIEIDNKKFIFKETLNSSTKTIIPDTFFIKFTNNGLEGGLIFLLEEKLKLVVCLIKE